MPSVQLHNSHVPYDMACRVSDLNGVSKYVAESLKDQTCGAMSAVGVRNHMCSVPLSKQNHSWTLSGLYSSLKDQDVKSVANDPVVAVE
jgi:hypothetical protein